MAWLLREGQVLASLDVARSHAERARGLVGREGLDGAVLIRRARVAHAFGVRFPIDVAYLDHDLVVLRTLRLRPFMIAAPSLRARDVLVARDGAFARWSLKAGDRLEIKE